MKLNKNILSLCVLSLIIGCNYCLVLVACPPPPTAQEHNADTDVVVENPEFPGESIPNDTAGESSGDPVLLSSGEFLFKRTDSINVNTGLAHSFPITRTYRSKPSPVNQHIGRNHAGEIPSDEDTTLFSDVCVFRWIKPPSPRPGNPYDQYYEFDVQFNITPDHGFIDADYSFPFVVPPLNEDLWQWTGRALRFELGTGITYSISLEYTRKNPAWQWNSNTNLWQVMPYCPTIVLYRWDTEFTIPEFPAQEASDPIIPSVQTSPLSRGAYNQAPFSQWTPGWDMSYNMFLIEYPDPNPNDEIDGRQIHFYSGDGAIHIYTPSSVSDPVLGAGWRSATRDDLLKKSSTGSYSIYMKNRQTLLFSADGALLSISKNYQIVQQFHYSEGYSLFNGLRRLDAISDVYGRKIEFVYVDSTPFYPGNLSEIRDWAGRTWTYDYYPDGNLKSVTDPEGHKETYVYTNYGLLEKIQDENGVWIENSYDSSRRVIQQIIGGEVSTFSYNNSTVTFTDEVGVGTVVELNDDGYALSKTVDTEASPVTTEYEYNTKRKLQKIIYPEGNGYDLEYDCFDNLEKISVFSNDENDLPLTYSASYDTSSINRCFLTSLTDPRGHTTFFLYDISSRLETIRYPEVMTGQGLQAPEINISYNTYDLVETITSPDGIVIKYDYYYNDLTNPDSDPNQQGLIQTIVIDYGEDPSCLNIMYSFTHGIADANSYPTTDPNFLLTGMRTVTVENPDGQLTTLTYDALDLLRLIEDPNNHLTRLDYNADRKLEKVQRQFGTGWQEFEYGYNIMAKLRTITDSLGRTTELNYDERFQVNSITDANDNTTQKRYNTRKLIKELVDAENSVSKFDYNDNGQLRLITDAENSETEYQYDGYGRLDKVVYEDAGYEEYGYDAAGNITSFRNRAGEVITFGYDALNRLVDKKVQSDPNITLLYDIAGRLVDVSQGTESMSFVHDRLGRIDRSVDQNGYEVGYAHDAMGRRQLLEYPDGSFVTYEYDNVGRLQYVRDENGNKIVEYVHDALSRTTQVLYFRGQSSVGSMAYTYEDNVPASGDQLGNRIARIDYCCNPSHSLHYTYDKVGNAVAVSPSGGGSFGWSYGYDNVYQVRTADQATTNRQAAWTYDGVYNRTLWTDTLDSITIAYQNNAVNQYTQVGNVTPTYDARGNITTGYGGGLALAYDAQNRLVAAGHISYTYDLLGRRLSRTDVSGTTAYVWDGAHVIAEYFNGSLTRKYIYGPGMDNPVAMINVSGVSETWYYYYADALGSIRLLAHESGAIAESYAYDVYGRPRIMTAAGTDGNWLTEDTATQDASAVGNPYLFTARRWDAATALYHYRHRDYTPALGRFLQTDPLGYIDGLNLYAYVNNNPLNWLDPWGLCKEGEGNPNWTWSWGDFGEYVTVGITTGAAAGVMFGGIGAKPGAVAGAAVGAIGYATQQVYRGVSGEIGDAWKAPSSPPPPGMMGFPIYFPPPRPPNEA